MGTFLLILLLVGLDQASKYFVVQNLSLGESRSFLPHVIQLTRVHNTGAAWSSFSGKTFFLAIFSAVLIIAVVVLLIKKIVRHPLGVAACILIISGGLGNMIDRVVRGYVVDMIDVLFMNYPVFNLADCFVVIGSILGAIYYLFIYDKVDKKKE